METKLCNKCGIEKPATNEYFVKSSIIKSGLSNRCKECDKIARELNKEKMTEYKKEWYQKHKKERSEKEKLKRKIKKIEKEKNEPIKTTKICTKCGLEFPISSEYFPTNKKNTDGLSSWCRECHCKNSREYYHNNKAIISIKLKEYRERNRTIILKKSKERWYKNRKELLIKKKIYREKNKTKIAESEKRYKLENKDKVAERLRRYARENREMLKIKSHAKRAEKKELIHTLTIKQWNEIKEIFNNKCCYCGRERILEQDHFIPLSKGGAYTFNNIVPACKSCNSGKRNNDFFEWYPKQKFYSKEKEGYILKHIKEKKEGEVDVNTESVI